MDKEGSRKREREGGRYRIWTKREAESSMHIQSTFTISVNIRC